MILAKNSGHILPFYSDIKKQNRFQDCCDNRFGILTSDCALPPFQLEIPDNKCTIELINQATGATTTLPTTLFDIYFNAENGNYLLENDSVYIPGLPTGQHYLKISCPGQDPCFSEVMKICEFCGYEEPCLEVVSCGTTEDCCDIIGDIYGANVPQITLIQTGPNQYGFVFNGIAFVDAIVQAGALAVNCNYTLVGQGGNAFILTTTLNTALIGGVPAAAFPLTFTVDKTFVFPCGDTTALITLQLVEVIQQPISTLTSINMINSFSCDGPTGQPEFVVRACDLVTSKKTYEAICYSIPDQGAQTIVGDTATIPGNDTGALAIQRKLRTDCSGAIVTKPYLLTWEVDDPCGTYKLNEV